MKMTEICEGPQEVAKPGKTQRLFVGPMDPLGH